MEQHTMLFFRHILLEKATLPLSLSPAYTYKPLSNLYHTRLITQRNTRTSTYINVVTLGNHEENSQWSLSGQTFAREESKHESHQRVPPACMCLTTMWRYGMGKRRPGKASHPTLLILPPLPSYTIHRRWGQQL